MLHVVRAIAMDEFAGTIGRYGPRGNRSAGPTQSGQTVCCWNPVSYETAIDQSARFQRWIIKQALSALGMARRSGRDHSRNKKEGA